MTHDEMQKVQSREQRIAWDILRNSATGRTAALSGRLWPFQLVGTVSRRKRARDDSAESDRRYFRRRSDEERRAARAAASLKAREAHAKLSELYADFACSFEAPVGATRH